LNIHFDAKNSFTMEIAEIIKSLSILQVLEHYHLKPNRNKMVYCPFHDDKNPSRQVYAETNTVFCFSGNCKMNGKKIDAIQFIQEVPGRISRTV
jgi:DNA primase